MRDIGIVMLSLAFVCTTIGWIGTSMIVWLVRRQHKNLLIEVIRLKSEFKAEVVKLKGEFTAEQTRLRGELEAAKLVHR